MEERNFLNGQHRSRSVECFLDRSLMCFRRPPAAYSFRNGASTGDTARTFTSIPVFILIVLPVLIMGSSDLCCAADTIPGESRAGFFYTITHLHPAAYFILFLTFILSILNLMYQVKIGTINWRWLSPSDRSRLPDSLRSVTGQPFGGDSSSSRLPGKKASSSSSVIDRPPETVVSVRKIEDNHIHLDRPPTPLDGIDHPLPLSAEEPPIGENESGTIAAERSSEKVRTRFRFSSAVELPSPEELERRDKEKLVVSGVVQDRSGKAIPSVMVYLTNENGKRVGQSSRSQPDTGEFTVMINEPGKYRLNGHKRGMVMDGDPPDLPINSGRIEGYSVRMILEGCLVQGRVIDEAGSGVFADLEVKCVCPTEGFARSVKSGEDGGFSFPHVPYNSDCFLEVRQSDGSVLARSADFQTAHRREIFQELSVLPLPVDEETATDSEMESATAWIEEAPEEDDTSDAVPVGPMNHT